MARILVIGAHPDDCDCFAGGTALLWRQRGDAVRFVSMTSGDSGHYKQTPSDLAARRREEAARAGASADVDYQVLAHHDGQLEPTLEVRYEVIRLIRTCAPDLVLTHRPNDYHPDHRYTSIVVQDAAYMGTVPMVCPETTHLAQNPIFGYLSDDFARPCPFRPDVIVDVEAVIETKWKMLDAHASQFYEWLPYNEGVLASVPDEKNQRLDWLRGQWTPRFEGIAKKHHDRICDFYGDARASKIRLAEAFEVSEYGKQPTESELRALFPIDV